MIENINNDMNDYIDTLIKINDTSINTKRISSCLRVAVNMNDLKNVPNPRGYLQRFNKNTNKCKHIPVLSPIKKSPSLSSSTKHANVLEEKKCTDTKACANASYNPHTDTLTKYFHQWKMEITKIKQKRQIDTEHEQYQSRFEHFLENLKTNKTNISIENGRNKVKKVNFKSPNNTKRKPVLQPTEDLNDLNRIDRELKQSMADTRESKKSLLPSKPVALLRQPLTILKSSQMALQRQQQHSQILERKRILQEQRQHQLLEEEKRQKILLIRQKQEQADALREKRRLEHEHELYLNVVRAQNVQLNLKARHHYERKLKTLVFVQWKLVCENSNNQMKIAAEYCQVNILRKTFEAFRKFTRESSENKLKKADNFYNTNILRVVMSSWKYVHQEMRECQQVAEDYYDYQLCSRTFNAWFRYAEDSLVFNEKLMLKAAKYHNRQLLCKYFGIWIELPIIMKALREKEVRKEKWVKRVQDILPNFHLTKKDNSINN